MRDVNWAAVLVFVVVAAIVFCLSWALLSDGENLRTCKAAGYDAVNLIGWQAYCVKVRADGVMLFRRVEDVKDGN